MQSKIVVIFDMDGLLFNTEAIFIEQAKKIETELGWKVPSEVHEKVIGRNEKECAEIFIEEMGNSFPYAEYNNKINMYIDHYINEKGAPLKPGVLELLAELQKRGIICAVASSSNKKNIYRNLDSLCLRDRFSVIVGGDEVTHGKPHPEIFLKVAELLAVEPQQCVVLEDSENGIRAAHAAGIKGIMVPDRLNPDHDIASLAFLICKDLFEVKSKLEFILF